MSGDDSGRVMKFDARTRKTSVLVDKLKFPNGVALSRNGDFLLSVETTTCKLYKLWLKTRNVEVVIDGRAMGIRLDRNGNVVDVLEFGKWKEVSEVHGENGSLWIGPVIKPFSLTHTIPNSNNFL
ncbi:hypothetical protein SASPL_112194 [Salvia splendens]|uniref:Strictosidine synthase conserved region domain-containing protein n=1 Tax=Salvia splendens TaxID=180675 RepID=A0A8X9A518_SALSN|nr:hypothetical protein SASPL_112194 [Salvia splendens]